MRVNSKDWVKQKQERLISIFEENDIMNLSISPSGSPGGKKGKCKRRLSYKEALTGKMEHVKRNTECQAPRDSDDEEHSLRVEVKGSMKDNIQFSPRPEIAIPSSSTPSAPSSPSPPLRSTWWPPRTRSSRPRPDHPRGGWQRHFQHHFPPSQRMVFSAPHGVRTARRHQGCRGNVNINHHARHRPSPRNRFYDSSSEVFQNSTVSRKLFPRPRSHRGEIKSQSNRERDEEKFPTPIVSISTAFNQEDGISKYSPTKDQVSRLICFPTCTGRRESTVHFFPDRFSMPSYSFDMIFYQKLAMVLGSKGKIPFLSLTKFPKVS